MTHTQGAGRASIGVRILGSGLCLPEKRLTNADLEACMDTSDEWIVKRTGITERRRADWDNGEKTSVLATKALREALSTAKIDPSELDLILVATMTPDTPTPSVSCIVAREIGAGNIAAIDINAACSGFVYTMNVADTMVRSGMYRTVAVIGADCVTRHIDYSTYGRGAAILFGDAAAAVVLRADDNPGVGMIAQRMHSDGAGSKHLFIPEHCSDFPDPDDFDERKLDKVQMNGQAVFKFAVSKFQQVINDTLEDAGLTADDIDHFVCHQANSRILESARERFGIPEEKLLVNIHKFGNTVSASAPLVFEELRRAGKVEAGQKVMFLAFGAGLTWGSSLWQL
ncbi:MAG: ketoacyl-ACP synthase III [Phycisphaerales bacterium]|nr:ketoacyl-ACP synthase III [Phycisphaerales bacterium]